ncbi:hypothetical protein [Cupriavidus sp. Agwp_2]|uniref:hypothetical protein n=1 Tax=Cupriavidus sp. Agwp_2 TaxID=2897324 RepID=UPI0034616061
MQTINPEVLKAAERAMVFLTPPHETEAERAAAMERAAALMLEVTVAFLRAGRDDLAFRASELAMDAR